MNAVLAQSQIYVDPRACGRAGELAAHGLTDFDISAALMLTEEQVTFARGTEDFQHGFSRVTKEKLEGDINRARGWDAIEDAALSQLLSTLEHTANPNLALRAAATANRAVRRNAPERRRVIDPAHGATVVVINLGSSFLRQIGTTTGKAVLDLPAETLKEIPRQQADMPSPNSVHKLLGIEQRQSASLDDEIKDALAMQGISSVMLE